MLGNGNVVQHRRGRSGRHSPALSQLIRINVNHGSKEKNKNKNRLACGREGYMTDGSLAPNVMSAHRPVGEGGSLGRLLQPPTTLASPRATHTKA